jgi:beta-galactosidase
VEAAPGFGQTLPASAEATRWVDGLNPTPAPAGAEVLLSYRHPHFGRWPAMTTRAHGHGRVTYVGTVPNQPLAIAISRWLTRDTDSVWRRQQDTQTVTGATAATGARLRVIHNWSFTPSAFVLPGPVRDLLSDDIFDEGQSVDLGPWDVRILAEL